MDYNVWYLPADKDTYRLHMVIPMTEAAANATECTEWLVSVEYNGEGRYQQV